jgi:hypothetical protein
MGRVAALCAVSAATFVLAACSSGQPTSPATNTTAPASSSTLPTTPPNTADKAKSSALTAYQAMWADFVGAATTSDWQSPKLGQHATGTALTTLTRGLFTDHTNGVVTRGEPTHNPQVSSAEPADRPTKVVVTDCSDSTKALKYRADNGQLADNTPGGRRQINAIVELQADASWKVSDFGVHEVGSC